MFSGICNFQEEQSLMIFSICFANCWFCQLPKTRSNIYAIKQQSVKMFSISFTNCWFCQLPEGRNNIYVIKHQFRHIFLGEKKLRLKFQTQSFKKSTLHICGSVTSQQEFTQVWEVYAGSSFIEATPNEKKKTSFRLPKLANIHFWT